MTIPEKIKYIAGFVSNADEKILDRIIGVIETSKSNIVGFTQTGDAVTKEDALNALKTESNIISNEELEKRREALTRLNRQDTSAKKPEPEI